MSGLCQLCPPTVLAPGGTTLLTLPPAAAGPIPPEAPPIVSSPRDGGRKPAIMCMIVDFPAPFGPSSPVTPGPIDIVTSLTATTLPYQRETLRSSMLMPG